VHVAPARGAAGSLSQSPVIARSHKRLGRLNQTQGFPEMPWSRVLRFTDPLPCQAAVQGSDVEILPTKSGDFQLEITQIGMDRLWMQRFHVSLP
jgi:hypothetical protein